MHCVPRFDPAEAITHGVETVNLCEISVDVANVGSDSWSLKTEKDASAKMSGRSSHNQRDAYRCLELLALL